MGQSQTTEKKTRIGTKMCHKNPQKNLFLLCENGPPQEVVLFLTLEVVLFLTLERLKRGTETNSPAYVDKYAGQLPAGPLKTFPESQFGDHKK